MKLKHPTSRAERLRLKQLKDHSFEDKVNARAIRKSIEDAQAKELEHELREQLSGTQEEAKQSINQD